MGFVSAHGHGADLHLHFLSEPKPVPLILVPRLPFLGSKPFRPERMLIPASAKPKPPSLYLTLHGSVRRRRRQNRPDSISAIIPIKPNMVAGVAVGTPSETVGDARQPDATRSGNPSAGDTICCRFNELSCIRRRPSFRRVRRDRPSHCKPFFRRAYNVLINCDKGRVIRQQSMPQGRSKTERRTSSRSAPARNGPSHGPPWHGPRISRCPRSCADSRRKVLRQSTSPNLPVSAISPSAFGRRAVPPMARHDTNREWATTR